MKRRPLVATRRLCMSRSWNGGCLLPRGTTGGRPRLLGPSRKCGGMLGTDGGTTMWQVAVMDAPVHDCTMIPR